MNLAETTSDTATETTSMVAAILDAALVVVGERGVKGATTRLIAQRADVHEVTIFRKFGTKTNLIKEAIRNRFEAVQRESVVYTGDVEADLMRLAQHYRDALEAFGSVARAMLTEVAFDPELADAMQGAHQLFGAVAEMLARYQAEGVLRQEAPQSLIPAFLGPIAMPYVTRVPGAVSPLDTAAFDARAHVDLFLYGRAGR